MLDILIGLLTSVGTTLLYLPVKTRTSYRDRMADIGRGITLSDQCDSCGEIKEKKFVLRDMSSQELRKLERECRESGLVEAERVHSYREFVVKKKLGVRSSRRRIRNKVRTALSGINDGLSLSELDEIATKLGMHPSAGVLVG